MMLKHWYMINYCRPAEIPEKIKWSWLECRGEMKGECKMPLCRRSIASSTDVCRRYSLCVVEMCSCPSWWWLIIWLHKCSSVSRSLVFRSRSYCHAPQSFKNGDLILPGLIDRLIVCFYLPSHSCKMYFATWVYGSLY